MSKKRSLISSIQTFMDSPKGRTYTNYIYSWGAAVVILGTLFKLTHIAGANLMLFIGMGAEVIVFFFSAFERPYELAEEDRKEERAERRAELSEAAGGAPIVIGAGASAAGGASAVDGTVVVGGGGAPAVGGPIIIGGGTSVAGGSGELPASSGSNAQGGGAIIIGSGAATGGAAVNPELVNEMDDATKDYVEKIRTLNEAIKRISEQTESLGRNMEEMDTLARNITGINALYEVQLRSASSQVGNIDLVNEETRKMAQQIKELNVMYARMLEAMTCNMNRQQ